MPALATVRSLESLVDSLEGGLREAWHGRDAARLVAMRAQAKAFEEELARGAANPVMEASRVQSLGESFEGFWSAGQRAVELAARESPDAEAAQAQALERSATLRQLAARHERVGQCRAGAVLRRDARAAARAAAVGHQHGGAVHPRAVGAVARGWCGAWWGRWPG